MTGYDISLDDLKQFRQWGSKTPGHPEYDLSCGIECTTGPLGQGFAMGVGMAIAERFLASVVNEPNYSVIDHYTYGLVSDGDLMEGISSEAASLAGHLQLGKLIYLYDDNHISIEGDTSLTFTEDVKGRFLSYNWHVAEVKDGNDLESISAAISLAQQEKMKPSLIMVRTEIGYGSPKQGSASAHGEPLGIEALAETKKYFDWPENSFHVPEDSLCKCRSCAEKGHDHESEWEGLVSQFEREFPEKSTLFRHLINSELQADWSSEIPQFQVSDLLATRSASGKVLNAIAARVPNLIGGSADLAPSTKTIISGSPDHSVESGSGRNIRFGVREHAMGAIVNGMALHGGVYPYGSTFLIFSDYMKPSLRLAALMKTHSIFVFTHDSIAVGEDGPTHQPVEQLISLRAIPDFTVIRPGDANETAEAWKAAMLRPGPTALILTRQNLPTVDRSKYAAAAGLHKGAYILSDCEGRPELILIASGSETSLALDAQEKLSAEGIRTRVVSMPCWEFFAEQTRQYRNSVLPPDTPVRLSIEAGSSIGWEKWVGEYGDCISVDKFGTSAPGSLVMKNYGFTIDNVVMRAKQLLSSKK
jgi:transketolase